MNERHPEYLGPDDEHPERPDDYYPVDDLEREAAGLPPLSSDKREVNPPALVHYSFLLWILAALVLVAGFVMMVANQREITAQLLDSYEQARRAGDPITTRKGVTPANIAEGVPGLLWLFAAGAFMFAGLFVLFAYKAREGTRSARTVLLALLTAMLVFVIGMPDEFVNFVQFIAVGIGLSALLLLFLPSVSGYFPKLPRVKRRWQDYS